MKGLESGHVVQHVTLGKEQEPLLITKASRVRVVCDRYNNKFLLKGLREFLII